MGEGISVIYF